MQMLLPRIVRSFFVVIDVFERFHAVLDYVNPKSVGLS